MGSAAYDMGRVDVEKVRRLSKGEGGEGGGVMMTDEFGPKSVAIPNSECMKDRKTREHAARRRLICLRAMLYIFFLLV